jgi:hypothetical protein
VDERPLDVALRSTTLRTISASSIVFAKPKRRPFRNLALQIPEKRWRGRFAAASVPVDVIAL